MLNNILELNNNKWIFSKYTHSEDSLNLASIPCQLLLANIFDKVGSNSE